MVGTKTHAESGGTSGTAGHGGTVGHGGTAGHGGAASHGSGELWPRERTAARLAQLLGGLGLYGVSEALMLAPGVGVDPWDVFHTGVAHLTGIPVGTVLIVVGVLVLLMWIPLRQRPGLGTAANVVVIGVVVDLILGVTPVPHTLWLRWVEFAAGVLLNAVATGLYIGAGVGAGPRDGLTTAIAAPGRSIRLVRSLVELSVLAVGWLLGGNVGLGTVVYAVAIGPLVHVMIPALRFTDRPPVVATADSTADADADADDDSSSASSSSSSVMAAPAAASSAVAESGSAAVGGRELEDACAAARA
ncbi:MAG TPA: hypothetical protein VH372_10960 [Actinospica sp.]|nr:hypothetical protein [Actinospica sp.]